jgi:hypothetical protein
MRNDALPISTDTSHGPLLILFVLGKERMMRSKCSAQSAPSLTTTLLEELALFICVFHFPSGFCLPLFLRLLLVSSLPSANFFTHEKNSRPYFISHIDLV